METKGKVLCNICNNYYANTKNLLNHQSKFHKDVIANVQETVRKPRNERNTSIDRLQDEVNELKRQVTLLCLLLENEDNSDSEEFENEE
jgi:uncharacterized Zn finger protein (UPF0148 family)